MVKKITLSIIFLLLTLFAVFLIGEMVLCQTIKYRMTDTPEMYVESKNNILRRELKPGYKGIYFGAPIEINSKGFRDYEYDIYKTKEVYRVALLGDSMCFGQGLVLEDTYAKVLESLLNNKRDFIKIQVLNFCVPGYNTVEEYEYLKSKVIFYKPDLVIQNFFLNDILPTGKTSLEKSSHGSSYLLCKKSLNLLKEKSYFVQFILSRIATLTRRIGLHMGYISDFHGAYERDNGLWLECQKQILNIKQFTENSATEYLVMIVPFLSELNKYHPLRNEIDIVEIFCKDNNIDNLNLFPYFYGYKAESLWINPINGHPNKKAHAIMANAVGKYILTNHLKN